MARELNFTAIILKNSPSVKLMKLLLFLPVNPVKLGGLAKSVKLAKSKLQNSLQTLFLVDLSVAGSGNLPKIIRAQPEETFPNLRENLFLIKQAFYVSELVLKFTPDGQKNEKLFDLLLEFLKFLQTNNGSLELALAKFKTDFLSAIGFAAIYHQDLAKLQPQLKQCMELEKTSFRNIGSRGFW